MRLIAPNQEKMQLQCKKWDLENIVISYVSNQALLNDISYFFQ